ncbi:trigger factor [Chromatiales bacterium (ex Bugula neritina AB1)]|nr:trigger factor [Chromatiales bacterium (ex Bugula neritina AB1)]
MQVIEESANGLERQIKVQVPAARIDDAVLERLRSLAKTARINGFRPGKVPLQVVRKRFGAQIRNEVMGDVINESYREALTQEQYRPAGMPSIVPVNDTEEGSDDFEYRAVFEVYPEIELADMAGSSIEKTISTVDDSDLEEMIETLRKQRVSWVDVDRPAENEDQVTMDFVGSIDGEEFPGGSAEGAPLVLGSSAMIPGFEEQLLGVVPGDSKVVSVSFPDDYRSADVAGKDAEFQVTIHAVKAPELPEVNDEFAKEFGVEEGGVEALRADILKNMERELGQSLENVNRQAVMEVLLEKNSFDVPSSMIKEEVERLRKQIIDRMQEQGQAEPPALGDELFQDDAQRRVKLGLLIAEIIKKHEIKPDPDKVKTTIESLASSYEDPKQVVDYYYGNPEYLQNIEGLVLEQQVTDWVLDQADIVDKPMKFKEVMNPEQATDGS